MNPESTDTAVHDMFVEYRAELCQYVMKSVGVGRAEAEDVVQIAFTNISQIELEDGSQPPCFFVQDVSQPCRRCAASRAGSTGSTWTR